MPVTCISIQVFLSRYFSVRLILYSISDYIVMSLFDNRSQVGKDLSEFLDNQLEIDLVIVPYPRAFEIGAEIADRNKADIQALFSDFILSNEIPYTEIGAVVEDGTIWIDDRLVQELDLNRSEIEDKASSVTEILEQKSLKASREREVGSVKNAVIVSEGLSDGFREAAVAGSLLKRGVENIYLVAPVKSNNVVADIETVVDQIFYLEEIPFLRSRKACYREDRDESKIEDDRANFLE